jgi:hypothetical protein
MAGINLDKSNQEQLDELSNINKNTSNTSSKLDKLIKMLEQQYTHTEKQDKEQDKQDEKSIDLLGGLNKNIKDSFGFLKKFNIFKSFESITKTMNNIGNNIEESDNSLASALNWWFQDDIAYKRQRDKILDKRYEEEQELLKVKKPEEGRKVGGVTSAKMEGKKDDFFGSLFQNLLGGLKSVFGVIGPLLLGGAAAVIGIKNIVAGIMTSGPWKGLQKMIGQGLLEFGLKLIKGIPIIGKEIFKFLDDIPKQLLKGFPKVFGKVMGTLIAKFPKGSILSNLLKAFAKVIGPIAKNLKFIPFIGSIIGLGFAISRFIRGDIIGGILDLASAIAGLIPGVGTAISIGISAITAIYDIATKGKGVKVEIKKTKFNFGGIIKSVGNFFLKYIDYIPFVGGIVRIAKGIMSLTKGNIYEGLKGLLLGLVYFIPGFGPLMGPVVSLLFDKTETKIKDIAKKTGKSPFQIIKDAIFNSPIAKFMTGIGKAISNGIKGIGEFFGMGWLFKGGGGGFGSAGASGKWGEENKNDKVIINKSVWESIKEAIFKLPVFGFFINVGKSIKKMFSTNFIGGLGDLLRSFGLGWVADFFDKSSKDKPKIDAKKESKGLFQIITEKIKDIFGGIMKIFTDIFATINPVELFKSLGGMLSNAAKTVYDALKGQFDRMAGSPANAMPTAVETGTTTAKRNMQEATAIAQQAAVAAQTGGAQTNQILMALLSENIKQTSIQSIIAQKNNKSIMADVAFAGSGKA